LIRLVGQANLTRQYQQGQVCSALIELRVMSSRSLRSAQARKRVPSLAAPSLGQDATLSFVVTDRGQKAAGSRQCRYSGDLFL
jgi:hypothetical protein